MSVLVDGAHTVAGMASGKTGEAIRDRRMKLGMTVKALAQRAGVDRGRLAAIEDGAAARSSTIGAIEATLARLEEEISGPYDGEAEADVIEFDITGDFGVHVVVKGPVADAETLKRQVVDIIREIKSDSPRRP